MTPAEFRTIRKRLKLSTRNMGLALGMRASGDPGRTVRRWEAGKTPISGLVATAMLALAGGFRPPWWPA